MSKLINLFILILLLTGCAQTQFRPVETIKPDDTVWQLPFNPPQGKMINAPSQQTAFLNNPVAFDYISVAQGTYMQIKGLTNEAVQDSINQTIKTSSMKLLSYGMTNLPPYRGIEQIITSDATLKQDMFDMRLTYNYNFVISFVLTRTMVFHTPKGEMVVDIEDGLTFDLNTGNPLSLSDLLTNDVDAKLWFNDLIMSYYVHGDDLIDMSFGFSIASFVESFKGLRHNQKFYLELNTLVLLFDFETPETQQGLTTNRLFVQFSVFKDQFALPTRFITNAMVFESAFNHAIFQIPSFEREPFEIDTIDINGYAVTQYMQLKSLNKPYVATYVQQIKDELGKLLVDLEYTTISEIVVYFTENKILDYLTIDCSININYDDRYTSKRLIQSFNNERALSVADLIPYSNDYQSKFKNYIRANFKNYTGRALSNDEVILDITQLGVSWSGFEVVVELEGLDYDLTMNVPYGVFDIQKLPLFRSTFALFNE
jgi:hypothetical protein